jgi:hypothetical protein
MSEQLAFPLPAPATSDVVVINARCTIHVEDEQRVVVVGGLAVHLYCTADPVATAYAMVFLANAGFATQVEIARAFDVDERTVRRHQQRYADGGMAALARAAWRAVVAGCRADGSAPSRLKAEGRSNYDIARRLG